MTCSKYSIVNTGDTVVTFNYQKCDSSEWQYQVELEPNEIKNIWIIDTTFSTAFNSGIVINNEGAFPPA